MVAGIIFVELFRGIGDGGLVKPLKPFRPFARFKPAWNVRNWRVLEYFLSAAVNEIYLLWA